MTENFNQIVKSSKTRQEIAQEYGIDRKTFYRWMKRTGLPVTKGLLCPSEMEVIYNTFGKPYSAENEMSSSLKRQMSQYVPICPNMTHNFYWNKLFICFYKN